MIRKAMAFMLAFVLMLGCMNGLPVFAETSTVETLQKVWNSSTMFSATQRGAWRYATREVVTNKYNAMAYDVTNNRWYGEGTALIWSGGIHTSSVCTSNSEIQTALQFVAPYSGMVTLSISGGFITVPGTTGNGVMANVRLDDNLIMDTVFIGAGGSVAFPVITANVTVGQVISFFAWANGGNNADDTTGFAPIVSYNDITAGVNHAATTFYISSSMGNDQNNGLTPETALNSLSGLSKLVLTAGDNILLKSGDVWYGSWSLDLSGGTPENPIEISSYGNGAKPRLYYYNGSVEKNTNLCLILYNANGLELKNVEIGYANAGILFEYQNSFDNEYVRIEDCDFRDIYGITQVDNSARIPFSAAILVATRATAVYYQTTGFVLSEFYINRCTADDAGSLTGYNSNVHNLYMTNCRAVNNGYYGAVITCDGGYIDNCVFDQNGTRDMPVGSAGLMLSASNFTVKNSFITNQQRLASNPDGCGIDFEWLNHNVVILDCDISYNAGVGIMFFTSGQGQNGTNTDCIVYGCTFIGNNINQINETTVDIFATGYSTLNCVVGNNRYLSVTRYPTYTTGFLYEGDSNNIISIGNQPLTNEFSSSEMFSAENNGVWEYALRNSVTNKYTPLIYNSTNNCWQDVYGAMIWAGAMHTSMQTGTVLGFAYEMQTALTFFVPTSDEVTVSMEGGSICVPSSLGNGIRYQVWVNDTPVTAQITVSAGQTVPFSDLNLNVNAGDKIRFLAWAIDGNNTGDSITISPVISYKNNAYDSSKTANYSAETMFSATQSDLSGMWRYLKRNINTNAYSELAYNGTYWTDGIGSIITDKWMHPNADGNFQTALEFVAPYDGNVKISDLNASLSVAATSLDGIRLWIWKNDSFLFESNAVSANGKLTYDTTTAVSAGDRIRFILIANQNNAGDVANISPVVHYVNPLNSSVFLNSGGHIISENNIITNVNPATIASTFTTSLGSADGFGTQLIASNSHVLTSNEQIGTGTTVKLYRQSILLDTYTVVIFGDVSGDSFISVLDLVAIKKHLLKVSLLTGASEKAARVSGKSSVSLSDLLAVKKQILGVSTINQNTI